MRNSAKALARQLAFIAVLPVLAYYAIVQRLAGGNRVLESCSQLLALVPGLPGQYVRRAFLARALEHCGKTAVVSFGVVFSCPGARIEDGAYIGPFCTIGLAHIGRDALIAAGAQIPSGRHTHGTGMGTPFREQAGRPEVVRIGPGAWVGNNAVVMADVGEGCIVGAGAVVTRPIPSHTVVAGVPARPIRRREMATATLR